MRVEQKVEVGAPQKQVMEVARKVVAERGWGVNGRTEDRLDVSWPVSAVGYRDFRGLSISLQATDSGGTLLTVKGDSRGLTDLRLMRRTAAAFVATVQTDLDG
jgi:hypothetical protein